MGIEIQEGDCCPISDCEGTIELVQESCICGVVPAPCYNCVNAQLECNVCGWSEDELD